MKKVFIALVFLLILGGTSLAFAYTQGWVKIPTSSPVATTTPESWECDGDAYICPDGSSVGRTGPRCEFAACPAPNATSSILTTYVGGTVTGLAVSVNPKEVISDSRCPVNVQCVWAGTVEVRTVISTQVAHGEHILKLGEPQTFGDFFVTLVAVTPAAVAGEEIPDSSYRFTFEVKKK